MTDIPLYFMFFLKDVEATPDKDDSRSLHIVIQQPFTRRSKSGFNPLPVLTAKFIFDDYIRCMSARQRLQKRCDALRHRKMTNIATLLELPALASPSNYYSITSLDNSNAVWSPSSRGYSSSRNTSGYSSPNNQPSTPTTPSPSALSTPQTKPRILSPKMEQILQKQQGGRGNDDKKTPQRPARPKKESHETPLSRNTPSAVARTPRTEAVALASLLQTTPPLGPIEITTGHADAAMRQRSSTMEVGVEIEEECSSDVSATLMDASSSFVMLNTETSIEPVAVNTPPQVIPTPTKTGTNLSGIDKSFILDIRRNASSSSNSQSAPGSPSGRRTGGHFPTMDDFSADNISSKSLPAIELKSHAEERKQRAHRARVKANTAKKLNNKKHGDANSKKP